MKVTAAYATPLDFYQTLPFPDLWYGNVFDPYIALAIISSSFHDRRVVKIAASVVQLSPKAAACDNLSFREKLISTIKCIVGSCN